MIIGTMQMLGGVVESSDSCEYGPANITTDSSSQLFSGEPTDKQQVWMSHGDHAEKLPQGFTVAARSETVGLHHPAFGFSPRQLASCVV